MVASANERSDDPIAAEAERARQDADRSLLPSNDGLGPGAGETPAAAVTVKGHADDAEVTSTPSLGKPPRKAARPDFRSSQLDGAPPESDGANG